MSVLLYGPDAFTVGSDITLNSYNPDWIRETYNSGADLTVVASTDLVQFPATGEYYGVYYWNGGAPDDHRSQADIRTYLSAPNSATPEMWGRINPSNGDGYAATWSPWDGQIRLYRVSNYGATWTQLAVGGSVSGNTIYTNAYINITGSNPVRIRVGDDTNAEVIDYNDSDAGRYTTGKPGMALYQSWNPGSGWLDNAQIWDETTYISISDVGSGTDALSLSAQAPLADSGSGSDALVVIAQIPLSDSGTGADALGMTGLIPVTDEGAGADAMQAAASVPLADAGSGSEQMTTTGDAAIVDGGAGTEDLNVVADEGMGDAGAGMDALGVVALIPLEDMGTSLDAMDVFRLLENPLLEDSGHGVDTMDVDKGTSAVNGLFQMIFRRRRR